MGLKCTQMHDLFSTADAQSKPKSNLKLIFTFLLHDN